LRLLISLGIGKADAEVYLYLVTNGPRKGRELSQELNMYKQQIYRSLKKLQKIGLVKKPLKRPALFTAITIEDSLDSFRETKLEKAEFIKEKKEELLSRWRNITKKNSTNI
jgi:sugar-specific transcriptional regulator TrmB